MSSEAAAAAAESRDNHKQRHLPDGRVPSTMNDMERTDGASHEEETLRMLGLDASTKIDPSSLRALQELCGTPKSSHNKSFESRSTTLESNLKQSPAAPRLNNQVPTEVLRPPIAFGRVHSDLTMGLRSSAMAEEETDASTAGSTGGDAAVIHEKQVMDQLQMQTALIMDLQRRVEDLTNIVLQQQQGGGHVPTTAPPARHLRGIPPPPPAEQQAPPPQQVPPPPQQQHEMIVFQLYQALKTRFTKICEIGRVFMELHRRDVRMDGNLILKIVIAAAILMAKLRRRGSKGNKNLQLYVAVVLIVTGFLLQSGYAKFLYNFIHKERYPQRIWNGEQVVVEAQRPAPPAAAPRAAAAAQRQPNILRGAIPRPAGGGIGGFVMDVVYLLGSFVLSILPMWKPEAMQEPQEEEEQEQDNGGAPNEGGPNDQDNNDQE